MADENTTFLESRKVQLVLVTAAMAMIPTLLMAAMVFMGKATSEEWAALAWKLFTAGIGAPGTAAIFGRAWEGAASKKGVGAITAAGDVKVEQPMTAISNDMEKTKP